MQTCPHEFMQLVSDEDSGFQKPQEFRLKTQKGKKNKNATSTLRDPSPAASFSYRCDGN